MTIDELIVESLSATDRFWFIQTCEVVERTDFTVTLRLTIGPQLFVQIFLSQQSDRFSFALIGASGRLYGRDREHGLWHRHPFNQPSQHELTPEGMSPQPIIEFLAEIEKIMVEHDLL
jgi:hypothetical protein